jgi:amylosucrase
MPLPPLDTFIPRLQTVIPKAADRRVFRRRLEKQFPRLIGLLHDLYGERDDFAAHVEHMILVAAEMYVARPTVMKKSDVEREADRSWFQRETVVGAVFYVDLFAGDFGGVREKIPYLQELGITYLHLMPLFMAPVGNSDGGYAVSSYRETNPTLGSMADLRGLAAELREAGVYLVLDFIFNHTSSEHDWAVRARRGEEKYRDFYRLFPDRTLPDQYEQNLREIFPEQSPGNFTWNDEVKAWVWTTFYNFQWDLNYANPAVLMAMMGEMLFLANVGVDVLRLDAVAFVWKRMGTPCENLPEAHKIIQALNALVKLAAPGMIFKSEAIVHPDDVTSYIGWEACPVSYNPTLMAMTWDALATRRVGPLLYAMRNRYPLPDDCVWVNYIRVHDDIGWSFADDDMAQFGINGYDHRQFLNRFYTGQFEGSFARGLGFNYNPVNQDMRIVGTAASLAGLEQALEADDEMLVRHAINRLLMIHSLILSSGGIPLLYIGDEIATLNDYSYQTDPRKANDSRWVHRPYYDWERNAARTDTSTPQGEVFTRLQHMIHARKQTPALGGAENRYFDTGSPHVLGYVRNDVVLCLHNFAEVEQTISRGRLAIHWAIPGKVVDLTSDRRLSLNDGLTLGPYSFVWLTAGR